MSEKPYYETMYILRPDIPEEEVDSHLKKYSEILEKSGTEVLDSQMRGKRRLAYPIAKHKEGIYVQLSHTGNGQQVAILERAMRLSEDVIRYLTVKQDGPLPTPKSTSKEDETEKSETEKEEIKPTEDKKTETPDKDEKNEEAKE
ncbi:30S ribosomal protein S6 [Prochlorococcus marinus]|uniref:30S ribosomal protein S6 n=1 Tax=Prochlorococcus marinus TaxID=1219 RepID=UPI0022B3194B|nr:30S ribosomal protein S6 [Prochlorococcus marinus]